MKKIFIMIMAIVATLSPLASHANVDDSNFTNVSMHKNFRYWNANDDWTVDIISNDFIFGVYWKTHYIIYKDYLTLGIPSESEYISELYTTAPITTPISSLSLLVSYTAKDLNEYVRGVDLVISKNEDFSDPIATIHHDTSTDTAPHIWYFDIPYTELSFPTEGVYYKFLIDCKSALHYEGYSSSITTNVRAGKWMTIDKMGVYWAEVLDQPTISVPQTQEGEYTLLSESGELHALIVEYDKNGNVVTNHTPIAPDESQSVAERSADDGLVDLDNTSWRNKVAGQGVAYTISAPQAEGNYLMIRAKSVYRTNQSEELFKYVTTGGITTGVKCVNMDQTDSSPVYYTLSGIPVAQPTRGIYIKVKDGKAQKMTL